MRLRQFHNNEYHFRLYFAHEISLACLLQLSLGTLSKKIEVFKNVKLNNLIAYYEMGIETNFFIRTSFKNL